MCEKITSIRVKEKTKQQINKLKIHHRETQEEVLERIIKPLLEKKELEKEISKIFPKEVQEFVGVNNEREY